MKIDVNVRLFVNEYDDDAFFENFSREFDERCTLTSKTEDAPSSASDSEDRNQNLNTTECLTFSWLGKVHFCWIFRLLYETLYLKWTWTWGSSVFATLECFFNLRSEWLRERRKNEPPRGFISEFNRQVFEIRFVHVLVTLMSLVFDWKYPWEVYFLAFAAILEYSICDGLCYWLKRHRKNEPPRGFISELIRQLFEYIFAQMFSFIVFPLAIVIAEIFFGGKVLLLLEVLEELKKNQ